jgi:hypothetical protein
MGPWPLPQNFNGPYHKPNGHSLHAFFVEKVCFQVLALPFLFTSLLSVKLHNRLDVNTEFSNESPCVVQSCMLLPSYIHSENCQIVVNFHQDMLSLTVIRSLWVDNDN